MATAKTYNNSLTKICSYSFTSNHLLVIQLVRSIPNDAKYNTATKSQYFFMFTLAPGEKSGNGDYGRTYNFEKAANIKFNIHELMAFGFVIKRVALGQGQLIGNYVKFSNSSTGQKRITVRESSKTQKGNDGEYVQRQVNIGISAGTNHMLSLNLEDAYAMSDVIEKLSSKALDLEFSRQETFSSNTNQVVFENSNSTQSHRPQFNNAEEATSSALPTDAFANMINNASWDE